METVTMNLIHNMSLGGQYKPTKLFRKSSWYKS